MVRWCSSRRGCVRTNEGSCPSHRNHDSPSSHPRPSGHSCQQERIYGWLRGEDSGFTEGKRAVETIFSFRFRTLSPDEGSLGEARQPGSRAAKCGGKGWPGRHQLDAPCEPHKRPTHKHGHTCPGSLSERTTFFLQGPPSSRASGQQGRMGRGPGDRGRDRTGVGLPIFCSQSHRGGGCWPGSGADKPVG